MGESQTRTEVDKAKALANVIVGNEYFYTEENYAFEVLEVNENPWGQIFVDTDKGSFFEPEWWGLRQDGAIEKI